MSAWDIMPHRLLLNRSLRKASTDLRSRIDESESEINLAKERWLAEIEQTKVEKDMEYEKVILSLTDELAKDADLFEKVQTGLIEYADQFLRRKCSIKMKKSKELEMQALLEHKDFLTTQMRLIGEEITILESRKDKLVTQAEVNDILELFRLTGCEIADNDNDDAISLLTKVKEIITLCEVSESLKKQALLKLRSVLQERVDMLPLIQYISWTIKQKKQLSQKLSGDRRKITNDIKNLKTELREISKSITDLDQSLEAKAKSVRAYWAEPSTRLNIQIDYHNRKLDAIFTEVKEISERIEHMKSIRSNDSSSWDRLWSEKNGLKEQIPQVKNDIDSLKAQRKQWFERKQMLYSLCKKNNVYLISDGQAEDSDEYQIIDSKLAEFIQAEEEANQREKERFERESSQIQKEKTVKIDELSVRIKNVEVDQLIVNAVLDSSLNQLSNSKSRDTRFFLRKIFSKTDEVKRAEQYYKLAASKKKKSDDLLLKLKTELSTAIKDFDKQILDCSPKSYKPSLSEIAEREKLESRKNVLLEKFKNEGMNRTGVHNEGQV